MVSEIKLGCADSAWGRGGFVNAVSSISQIGFDGVECTARLVREYEDRLHVFEEILDAADLRLCAMRQAGDFLNTETADETVERVANSARFLNAFNSACLVVTPINRQPDEMTAEEWTTVAAILEEMGMRCQEFGITLCFRPRAGFVGGGDRELKKLLGMVDERVVNLCLDSAELELAGISVERFLKNFGERVIYARARDVSGAKRRADTTSDQPGSAPQFGRGAVDFTKVSKALLKGEYHGWVTVDVAGEAHMPGTASEDAFNYMVRKSELFL